MKVAVMGATGFVGRHVVRELCARPEIEVVAAARNIDSAAALPPGIQLVQLDLAQPAADHFQRLGAPDVLIHLAWDGLPNYLSLHHFESQLPRQYDFLRGLVHGGLQNLVVAGTCFEYGMSNGEMTESLHCVPTNPYAYAKLALLQQLQFLRSTRPFGLTWTRLFYMYGDDQPPGSLYPQLRAAVARGDKIFSMSRGEQLRDYLPVRRVAELCVDLALRCRDAGIVNVCSGTAISVRRLVEQLLQENGWSIELQLGSRPYAAYEPLAFWGSNARLESLLAPARS